MTNGEKIETCKNYLREPLLEVNKISLDESADSKIQYTPKTVKYPFHEKEPETHLLLQCPVKHEDKRPGYFYMSPLEQTAAEKTGHYFIFAEHSVSSTELVRVLMRSEEQARRNGSDGGKQQGGNAIKNFFGMLGNKLGIARK